MVDYDVIIVGSRCSGAAAGMLLARQGHRVLLLDKDQFPSNKMSTHFMKRAGVAFLDKWGVLDQVATCGAPIVNKWDYNYEGIRIVGQGKAIAGIQNEYAVRRLELDQILIEAAQKAGAHHHAGFRVTDLIWSDERVVGIKGTEGDKTQAITASIVIGADGLQSTIARKVNSQKVVDLPTLNCGYYAYFSGMPVQHALESHQFKNKRLLITFPTNDDLHVVFLFWPSELARSVRSDLQKTFFDTLKLAPSLLERVRDGQQESQFFGTPLFSNFMRKSWGAGWALIGDAAMHRDPITAYGMSNAFADADLISKSVNAFLSGDQSFDEALNEYEEQRLRCQTPPFQATVEAARMHAYSPEAEMELNALSNADQIKKNKFITRLDQSLYSLHGVIYDKLLPQV